MRPQLLTLAFVASLSAQAPAVLSVSPGRHAAVGPFEPIVVTFAAPIAPATVTSRSFTVFGRWTGAVAGTVSVDAANRVATFQPTVPMLVGDHVMVDLTSSITSAGGLPLTGGHHVSLHVRSAPGSGVFQQTQTIPFRAPGEGWISTYGIHAGDIDRDGAPDITAINEAGHDLRIFRNGGCADFGAMTQVSDGSNWPSPHESADVNRDGWLDLVTGDYLFGNISVFVNDGAGSYLPPQTLQGNQFIRSIGVGDFDGDGWHDIVAANGASTLVFLNDGTGGFLAPVAYSQRTSGELNVADVDEDGILDIVSCTLVAGECYVLRGNGDGTFSPTSTLVPLHAQPFQSAVADLDNDGHIDVAYCCNNPDLFVWLRGDGQGGFAPGGSSPLAPFPTSIHLGDLDGDGDMEAVVSHFVGANFYVFFNDGSGNFSSPLILPAPAGASCTTLADFDRDGDLDILGADETVDVGILFTQINAPTPGIQPSSCDARLRIDQRADSAGFNSLPAVPVRLGAPMSVSLSGQPGSLAFVVLGFPGAAGLSVPPWGLVSINVTIPYVLMTIAPLDAKGNLLLARSFPTSAPPGSRLVVQALVLNGAFESFSNPMQFVLLP